MTFRRARQTPPLPQIVVHLAAQLGVTRRAAETWWSAVRRAQCAEARSLSQDVAFFDARMWTLELLEAFFTTTVTPQRCCTVLEALVTEGLLTRPEATVLEDAVLRQTDRTGSWRR